MKLDILRVVPVVWVIFGKERADVVPVMTLRFDRGTKEVGGHIAYGEWSIAIRWPFFFQLQGHLTRYGTGAYLEKHTDPINKKSRQFRLLIVLREAKKGGELICPKYTFFSRRVRIFEPSKHEHEVTTIEEGQRTVLLIGLRYGPREPTPFF